MSSFKEFVDLNDCQSFLHGERSTWRIQLYFVRLYSLLFRNQLQKYFSAEQQIAFIVTKGVWYALRCYVDGNEADGKLQAFYHTPHVTLSGAKVIHWFEFSFLILFIRFSFEFRVKLRNSSNNCRENPLTSNVFLIRLVPNRHVQTVWSIKNCQKNVKVFYR